jgi:hypothetical protein
MKGAQECGELVLANWAKDYKIERFAALRFPKAAVQDGNRRCVTFGRPAGTEQAGKLSIVCQD